MKRLIILIIIMAFLGSSVLSQVIDDSVSSCVDSLRLTLYDYPYSRTLSLPDWRGLGYNTAALYGAGFVTLGVLELLPEDATAWNKAQLHRTPLFERWWNHVSGGPRWDHDNAVFDYVLHPYGGAAYFMSARSRGFNMWQSALYSAAVSTLFWEYGIEAFMEYPSIQDLVITPVVGSVIGECFYKVKRRIVANDYRLCGSSLFGHTIAWLVDPVNEFIYLFTGNPTRHPVHATLTTAPHHLSLVVTF